MDEIDFIQRENGADFIFKFKESKENIIISFTPLELRTLATMATTALFNIGMEMKGQRDHLEKKIAEERQSRRRQKQERKNPNKASVRIGITVRKVVED